MPYAFEHEGKAFTPDGALPEGSSSAEYNAQIEAQELAAWMTQPGRMFVYVRPEGSYAVKSLAFKRVDVTTWTGALLGSGKLGAMARGIHDSIWYPIRVKGTNGAEYSGRYYASSGDYARLKRCKER